MNKMAVVLAFKRFVFKIKVRKQCYGNIYYFFIKRL